MSCIGLSPNMCRHDTGVARLSVNQNHLEVLDNQTLLGKSTSDNPMVHPFCVVEMSGVLLSP